MYKLLTMKMKNPYQNKVAPVMPVTAVPNKAVANYPANNAPKSGIARMVDENNAAKMARKTEIEAMGTTKGKY